MSKKELKTAMDFLEFFDTIPDDKWCIDQFQNYKGQKCVRGHLGIRSNRHLLDPAYKVTVATRNDVKLNELCSQHLNFSPSVINNVPRYFLSIEESVDLLKLGDTPKERIMNALYLINAGVKL